MPPVEWLGAPRASEFPIHLMSNQSNQPKTRLHSQLDSGAYSRSKKVHEREVVTINRADAEVRGIRSGDIVRVFNQRGSCLAAAKVSTIVRAGVAELPTGAWYDPLEPGVTGTICKHGNPNVLTPDKGTSKLAQGPSAHSCLVQIERSDEALPPITAFVPPEVIRK